MSSDILLDVSLLLPPRTAHVSTSESSLVIQDDWKDPAEQSRLLQHAWTGKTVFSFAQIQNSSAQASQAEVQVSQNQTSSSSVEHQVVARPILIQDQLEVSSRKAFN